MTEEEFIAQINDLVKTCPDSWRRGQAVFNVVDNTCGDIARKVQFEDGIDCFYSNDEGKINEFLDAVWERFKTFYIKTENKSFHG